MPYVNDKQYNKFIERENKLKERYKKQNQANAKRYDRFSVALPAGYGEKIDLICYELETTRNGLLNDIIVDFVNKYYQ